MPGFDRDSALKTAEKALRQGRIDAAIIEYLHIVENHPRDWNTANALGDLYVRSNQVDKGLAQYTRIADHLAAEGFYPKAGALYKKILKIKPDEEYALLQSGEIALKQGLIADAKHAFRAVADRRRRRGDTKGAAEISIHVGTLDPDDLSARLGAARAAVEIGDLDTALREFREVAFRFEAQGDDAAALEALQAAFELDGADTEVRARLLAGHLRTGDLEQARAVALTATDLKQVARALEADGNVEEMLAVLGEAATLDPDDRRIREQLAAAYVGRGELERARTYLDVETAGQSAPLWLALAEIELATGRIEAGKSAVARSLTLSPSDAQPAIALARRLADRSPEAAYACIDAVAQIAVVRSDFTTAAIALQDFIALVPHHIVGLMRLVEICVDGGLDDTILDAQAKLADAYLEVGQGLEARIISEDLVAREPWITEHIERFKRALVMLGETDPDRIVAERLSGDSPFLATATMDLNEGVFFEDPVVETHVEIAQRAPAFDDEDEELVDLDPALLDFQESLLAESSGIPDIAAPAPRSLEQVFHQMRDEVSRDSEEEAAEEQFGLAVTYCELGMSDDAIQALLLAVQSPRRRFEAASLLAALYLESDELASAIEWFERAAQAPAPSPDAGHALLYDLAGALEQAGEVTRALGVLVELEAESRGYRDAAARIDRLSKLQAKG